MSVAFSDKKVVQWMHRNIYTKNSLCDVTAMLPDAGEERNLLAVSAFFFTQVCKSGRCMIFFHSV